MFWRKQPKENERVYLGECHSCGKKRIHKKSQGKAIYCPECEVWDYNSSLIPYSIAVNIVSKKN